MNTKTLTFLRLGALSLLSFLLVSAPFVLAAEEDLEPGDNCEESIMQAIAEIPEDVTWDNVMQFQDAEDRVWTRGVLSEPRKTLEIEEMERSEISGLALSGAEVRMFLFLADEENGILQKPGEGTCFVAEKADNSDNFSFEVNATLLWDAIGREMVIDPFYLDPTPLPENENNQNFQIGTHRPAEIRTVTVSDQGDGTCPNACPDGHESIKRAHILEPENADEEVVGSDFNAFGNNPIHIGRLHNTYYSAVKGQANADATLLQNISYTTMCTEFMKQGLLGELSFAELGLDTITKTELEAIVEGESENEYSPEIVTLVNNIHNVLTDINRENSIQSIVTLLQQDQSISNMDPFPIDATEVGNAFPVLAEDDHENWAERVLEIFEFRTGRISQNSCIFSDLNTNPFMEQDSINSLKCNDELTFHYTSGGDPLLVIHTDEKVNVSPDFSKATLFYAERSFDEEELWTFPEGAKEAFAYEYTFTENNHFDPLFSACIRPQNLKDFGDTIADSLSLQQNERAALQKELDRVASFEENVSVRIPDPEMVSERLAWKIDGEKANIYSLFFDIRKTGCQESSSQNISLPTLSHDRNGFQVGFWQ